MKNETKFNDFITPGKEYNVINNNCCNNITKILPIWIIGDAYKYILISIYENKKARR